MQETWVQSLGWEDPLKKEMATHSSILAWEISWTEEPGRIQSMGSLGVRHNLATEQQQYSNDWIKNFLNKESRYIAKLIRWNLSNMNTNAKLN